MMNPVKQAIVVGGGVTGLCAAYYLARDLGRENVTLLEADTVAGGTTRSETVQGYACDCGPNGFLDREPATLEWLDALGLSGELIRANDSARRRFIYAEKNWHDLDDHSRAVRDARFKYIRNAFYEKPLRPAADVAGSPSFQKMRELRDAGTLPPEVMLHFRNRRASEELYDLACDAMEFHNVAGEPAYRPVLERMRVALDQWIEETNDISPEDALPDKYDPETGEKLPE